MMEDIQSRKVVSIGGLNSNVNHIYLSDNEPGSAVELVNFEPSLYGGYRRLSGFQYLDENNPIVDVAGAEGRILVVAIFNDEIIVARKQILSDTYDFYVFAGSSWSKIVTGLTRSSTGVNRIRFDEFNFNGTNTIAFVDGVNPACMYNGTTWTEIKSTNGGTNFADAGGNQAIDAPSYVKVFKNHLFLGQDHLVVHSSPLSEFNFNTAGGAGQLPVGFLINQIAPFREKLYVFGTNKIKNISVNDTTFVVNDVTSNIGCLAPDSIQEIDGNLIFLSQDGFRPISGTDRIGDIQLDVLSKKIQQLVTDRILSNDMLEVTSTVIRNKSQVRYFFSSPSTASVDTKGILGALRANSDGSSQWEWMEVKGIRASCTTSKYIGAVEYVMHGDYDGSVYRQELGNDFNGQSVEAIYTTPHLDFSEPSVRKTLRKIRLFTRPEGFMSINTRLTFDWDEPEKLNPDSYIIDTETPNTSIYGVGIYGTATYSAPSTPVIITNVEGSGFSVQIRFVTSDTNSPYTIQGALYEFSVEGKK